MKSRFALALLGCAIAASFGALAAPPQQEQLNLDTKGATGAVDYFQFAKGTQVKVTQLNCPPAVTVSVVCKTASHARCGSWYLGLNQSTSAGPDAEMGIATLNYSGNEICRATLAVQRP